MDIRFLESLIAVVEQGSISAAAKAQGLTATAISQRVKALEASFGAQLLVRAGHSAQPSRACLRLLPEARTLVARATQLQRGFAPLSGPLRIGAIETALSDHIPAVVARITHEAPACDLAIKPGTSAQVYDMLHRDQVDIAVVVAPPFPIPKMLRATPLARHPFALVQSQALGPVRAEDLKARPIILYDRSAWGGKTAWQWISAHADPQNVLCELDSMPTIASMVRQALGMSLLPLTKALAEDAGLTATRFPSLPPAREMVLLEKAATTNEPLFALCRDAFLGTALA